MAPRTISPLAAKQLVDRGALLVDIREADEHVREHIPGAQHQPLSTLTSLEPAGAPAVVFYCRSGNRTTVNAQRLAVAAGCEAFILEGGLDGWKRAGLPVTTDKRRPIEITRQVQIAAGALVLLGAFLGASMHPAFFALSAFVGAGFLLAGLTGSCAMAVLLGLAPWNRAASSGSQS